MKPIQCSSVVNRLPALSVLVFSTLLLAACGQKTAPTVIHTPPTVIVVPVASAPSPVVAPTVTVVETKTVVVKKATNVAKKATASPKAVTQAGVKVVVAKKHTTKNRKMLAAAKSEKEAYGVALVNKVVYVCFERLYAFLKVGPSSEELASIDANRMGFAERCIELQVVNMDDVKEFEGKV